MNGLFRFEEFFFFSEIFEFLCSANLQIDDVTSDGSQNQEYLKYYSDIIQTWHE